MTEQQQMSQELLHKDLMVQDIKRVLGEITYLHGSQKHARNATFKGVKDISELMNQSIEDLTDIYNDLEAIMAYVLSINKEWQAELWEED